MSKNMDGNFKENTDQADSTPPRAILRGLVYKNKQIPLELANELEQLLSSSMYLETASILKLEDGNQVASGGGIGVPAEALPWLWMILTFTSTTVATTILSKISEDIYNRLKQSIVG